jgi:hypothetical protein
VNKEYLVLFWEPAELLRSEECGGKWINNYDDDDDNNNNNNNNNNNSDAVFFITSM